MREPELSAVCGRIEEGFFDFAAARTGKRSEEQGRGHFTQNDTSTAAGWGCRLEGGATKGPGGPFANGASGFGMTTV